MIVVGLVCYGCRVSIKVEHPTEILDLFVLSNFWNAAAIMSFQFLQA